MFYLSVRKQDVWSRRQVKRNRTDPLWVHMGLILAQLDGLQAGVADWAKQQGKKVRNVFHKVCEQASERDVEYALLSSASVSVQYSVSERCW